MRTKSSRITSSADDRVTRASTADWTSASATVGRISERSAATGSPQPGNPPGGSQRSFTAKSSTSSMESQKAGTAMPSWLSSMMTQSPPRPCRAAAAMPRVSARLTVTTMPDSASERVSGNRSPISSATGTPKE